MIGNATTGLSLEPQDRVGGWFQNFWRVIFLGVEIISQGFSGHGPLRNFGVKFGWCVQLMELGVRR